MNGLVEHIQRRAEVTPRLTAVRFSNDAVTYAGLDDAIASYEGVMRRQGMTRDAALIAAILNCIPGITSIADPVGQLQAVAEVVAWLGRDLDTGSTGHLRAVS